MDIEQAFTQIKGIPVGVVLIFDDYSEKKYKKDFEEFLDYQKNGDPDDSKDNDLKRLRNVSFAPIPYEVFRKQVITLFSQAIFQMLKNYPHYLMSTEFVLQIRIIRIPGREYYFEHHPEVMDNEAAIHGKFQHKEGASDPETACFSGSGLWFLQNIVAPFVYTKKMDYSIVVRYFVHELNHHMDLILKVPLFDETEHTKIKRFAKKRSAYNLNYLFQSIFYLREEGMADFIARTISGSQQIDLNGIQEYNQNLRDLITLPLRAQAEAFYNKKIGVSNITPSGEYSNGRMMCLTIAMDTARERAEKYAVTAGSKTSEGSFFDINTLLQKNKIIIISKLSEKTVACTLEKIRQARGYGFVTLYESACVNLGISEEHRVMTWSRLITLKRTAIETAREYRKKRMKKEGFIPTELVQDD